MDSSETLNIVPEIGNHDEATGIAGHNLLLGQAASGERGRSKGVTLEGNRRVGDFSGLHSGLF